MESEPPKIDIGALIVPDIGVHNEVLNGKKSIQSQIPIRQLLTVNSHDLYLNSKHLHHLVAQMVYHLYRYATGFGFVERSGSVAVER